MDPPERPQKLLGVIALFVIAPVLTALLLTTLLLAGVSAHWVFLPGNALKSAAANSGWRLPNAVGVLVTAAVWWALIVAVWLAVRRIVLARRNRIQTTVGR